MEEIINILSYIDSLHDFYNKDRIKNCEGKDNYKNYLILLRDFYISKIGNYKNDINIQKIFNLFFNDIIDVDVDYYKKQIIKFIMDNFNCKSIEIDTLNQIIVNNFNAIFDFKLSIFDVKLFELINHEQKILLRQVLYFLIKTKDENIIDFILRYMKLDKLLKKYIKKIKEAILKNIDEFNKSEELNITYPVSFFDDMSSGLENKKNFNFKILNYSKDKIDAAKTQGCISYLESKNNLQLFINKIGDIYGFKMEPFEDVIKILGYDFYFDGEFVVCKYSDTIYFKIKSNSVEDIYNATYIIIKLFEEILNNTIINENKLNSYMEEEKFDATLNEIIDTKDLYKILNELKKIGKNGKSIIIFLLYGAKRFGDWAQVNLSKKYYFILQTTDYYCKMYSLLIGAPTNIEDEIYNYKIPDILLDENFVKINLVKEKIGKKTNKRCEAFKIIPNEQDTLYYNYTSLIPTKSTSRIYFLKYLKYKNKYLKLKNFVDF